MAQLDEKQREFLKQPFVGVATTLREDGSPHNTVVWVEESNGELSFNTAVGRAKERHIRQNQKVALTVVDPQDAYKWVSISGAAELTTDDADPQIDRLAKKYLGKDEYPWRSDTEQRIKVLITPDKVDASGLGG
jgi:PPOX class probable F420-dependent enzyme